MIPDDGVVEIVVCMGSSCFARGNAENLAVMNGHVQSHGLNVSIRLTGRLCQDKCKQGPNIMIDGELHQCVTSTRLHELLQQLGSGIKGDNGAA